MNRSRAALIYLWPSLVVLALCAAVIMFAWYPQPFLQLPSSGRFSVLLLISAALIGPVLIWFMYKQGKKGMLFDLVFIALMQLAAMGWGMYTLYLNRPYFMVFTLDRFEVLARREVDTAEISDPAFLDKPLAGPVLLYANMPSDPAAYQKLLREVMFEGLPDLQFRSEFWSLYDQRRQQVLDVSRPLADLREARPESSASIDKLVRKHGGEISSLRYVPGLLHAGQFAAVLDADSGGIAGYLVTDPWLR
ncbi:MAG: hypothetical protein OQJ84_02840 [Xanthomonadales bacterium]|nr:hypothetical protein [Xanthomonadales bacterium]